MTNAARVYATLAAFTPGVQYDLVLWIEARGHVDRDTILSDFDHRHPLAIPLHLEELRQAGVISGPAPGRTDSGYALTPYAARILAAARLPRPVPDSGARVAQDAGDDDPLMTPGEVAALFRVDPKTVTRWAAAGRIGSIRTPGGHRRFRESEVNELATVGAEDTYVDQP